MNKNTQQDQNFDEQGVSAGLEYATINATQWVFDGNLLEQANENGWDFQSIATYLQETPDITHLLLYGPGPKSMYLGCSEGYLSFLGGKTKELFHRITAKSFVHELNRVPGELQGIYKSDQKKRVVSFIQQKEFSPSITTIFLPQSPSETIGGYLVEFFQEEISGVFHSESLLRCRLGKLKFHQLTPDEFHRAKGLILAGEINTEESLEAALQVLTWDVSVLAGWTIHREWWSGLSSQEREHVLSEIQANSQISHLVAKNPETECPFLAAYQISFCTLFGLDPDQVKSAFTGDWWVFPETIQKGILRRHSGKLSQIQQQMWGSHSESDIFPVKVLYCSPASSDQANRYAFLGVPRPIALEGKEICLRVATYRREMTAVEFDDSLFRSFDEFQRISSSDFAAIGWLVLDKWLQGLKPKASREVLLQVEADPAIVTLWKGYDALAGVTARYLALYSRGEDFVGVLSSGFVDTFARFLPETYKQWYKDLDVQLKATMLHFNSQDVQMPTTTVEAPDSILKGHYLEQSQIRWMKDRNQAALCRYVRKVVNCISPDQFEYYSNIAPEDLQQKTLPFNLSDNFIRREYGGQLFTTAELIRSPVREGVDPSVLKFIDLLREKKIRIDEKWLMQNLTAMKTLKTVIEKTPDLTYIIADSEDGKSTPILFTDKCFQFYGLDPNNIFGNLSWSLFERVRGLVPESIRDLFTAVQQELRSVLIQDDRIVSVCNSNIPFDLCHRPKSSPYHGYYLATIAQKKIRLEEEASSPFTLRAVSLGEKSSGATPPQQIRNYLEVSVKSTTSKKEKRAKLDSLQSVNNFFHNLFWIKPLRVRDVLWTYNFRWWNSLPEEGKSYLISYLQTHPAAMHVLDYLPGETTARVVAFNPQLPGILEIPAEEAYAHIMGEDLLWLVKRMEESIHPEHRAAFREAQQIRANLALDMELPPLKTFFGNNSLLVVVPKKQTVLHFSLWKPLTVVELYKYQIKEGSLGYKQRSFFDLQRSTIDDFITIGWMLCPKWLESEEKAFPGFSDKLFYHLQQNPYITYIVGKETQASGGGIEDKILFFGCCQAFLDLQGFTPEKVIGKLDWGMHNQNRRVITGENAEAFRHHYIVRQKDFEKSVFNEEKILDFITIRDTRNPKLESKYPGIYLCHSRTEKRDFGNGKPLYLGTIFLQEMYPSELDECLRLGPRKIQKINNLPKRLKEGILSGAYPDNLPFMPAPNPSSPSEFSRIERSLDLNQLTKEDIRQWAEMQDEPEILQELVRCCRARIKKLEGKAPKKSYHVKEVTGGGLAWYSTYWDVACGKPKTEYVSLFNPKLPNQGLPSHIDPQAVKVTFRLIG